MIDKELLDILACPLCKSDIKLVVSEAKPSEGNHLLCVNAACGCQYLIRDDIPVMLIDEARRPCPKCGTQRDWNEEKGSLICPKCGATFQHPT